METEEGIQVRETKVGEGKNTGISGRGGRKEQTVMM